MFTAVMKNGTKLSATDAITVGGEDFFCPGCGTKVILRNGLVKIEHFSHNPGNSCTYAGESMLHIQMKSQIFGNLQRYIGSKVRFIELEKQLGNCRPDIYIEGKKSPVAIEVQASALTAEQILQRTARYHELGINVLWIVPYDSSRITVHGPFPNREAYATLKLKEYERIIAQMYFKTLTLWNVHRPSGMGFMAYRLGDTFTDGAEFYDKEWGEQKSYAPKRLKTIKEIEVIRDYIQLSDFRPQTMAAFRMPMARYQLPARKLMVFDWKKDPGDNIPGGQILIQHSDD